MSETGNAARISRSACLEIPRPGVGFRLFVSRPEARSLPKGWPVRILVRTQALQPRPTGMTLLPYANKDPRAARRLAGAGPLPYSSKDPCATLYARGKGRDIRSAAVT